MNKKRTRERRCTYRFIISVLKMKKVTNKPETYFSTDLCGFPLSFWGLEHMLNSVGDALLLKKLERSRMPRVAEMSGKFEGRWAQTNPWKTTPSHYPLPESECVLHVRHVGPHFCGETKQTTTFLSPAARFMFFYWIDLLLLMSRSYFVCLSWCLWSCHKNDYPQC